MPGSGWSKTAGLASTFRTGIVTRQTVNLLERCTSCRLSEGIDMLSNGMMTCQQTRKVLENGDSVEEDRQVWCSHVSIVCHPASEWHVTLSTCQCFGSDRCQTITSFVKVLLVLVHEKVHGGASS